MTLSIPTIHINGTGRQDLIDGYCAAVHALLNAGEKLAATCPNGRDYYVQGAGAHDTALSQHVSRMAKVASVVRELEQIAEAL